jgi:glycerol-3-phosphate acyltransferase PlsY
MPTTLLLTLLLSYLVGSIPFAHIIAKSVRGVDLKAVGSKNVGARNLTWQLGFGWGLLGGFLDFAKGLAAMWLAGALSTPYPASLLAGVAVVSGHNFPIWLRFRGGKGLSTAMGVAFPIAPWLALFSFAVWIIGLRLTKNVLIASVAAFAVLLISMTLDGYPFVEIGLIVALAGLVLLAALPDILDKVRKTGAVSEYFRDPEMMYKKKQKRAAKKK